MSHILPSHFGAELQKILRLGAELVTNGASHLPKGEVYYRVFSGQYFRVQKALRSGKLLLTLKNFPKLGPGISPASKWRLMRSNSLAKFGITFLMLGLMGLPAFAVSPRTSKKISSHRSPRIGHHLRRSSWKRHGQQQISGDRAREIQEALIREHYLDGQPSGVWDSRTQAAMRKFQADQGWQNRVIPDSRALIKLGLGPSHENDLNPDLMGDSGFTPLTAPLVNSNDVPRQ